MKRTTSHGRPSLHEHRKKGKKNQRGSSAAGEPTIAPDRDRDVQGRPSDVNAADVAATKEEAVVCVPMDSAANGGDSLGQWVVDKQTHKAELKPIDDWGSATASDTYICMPAGQYIKYIFE